MSLLIENKVRTFDHLQLTDRVIQDASGIILLYSVLAISTLNDIESYHQDIIKANSDIPIILVGNKIDLEDQRVVSREKGEEIALKFGMLFLETSAKLNINVDLIFQDLITEINQRGMVLKESIETVKNRRFKCVTS